MSTKILFFTVFSLMLVEALLRLKWNRLYYRSGFRLYKKRFQYVKRADLQKLGRDLTTRLKSKAAPNIVVHPISQTELAFREQNFDQMFKLRYTPIMHGIVEFVPQERIIVVSGRLDWSTIGFLVLFLKIASLSIVGILFFGFSPLIIAACYWMQIGRYQAVELELQEYLKGV